MPVIITVERLRQGDYMFQAGLARHSKTTSQKNNLEQRETKEELGISLNMKDIKLVKQYKTGTVWLDTYLIKQDIDLKDIIMQEEEVCEVKWATYKEIEELFAHNQFMENRWEYIKDIIKDFIGENI